MTNIDTPILEGYGIRLEPMTLNHRDGLAAAAADGNLWELWFCTDGKRS